MEYNHPLVEGQDAGLRCSSTGGTLPPTITMTLNDKPLPVSTHGTGIATFSMICSKNDNRKKLKCCRTYETFGAIGIASNCTESPSLSILCKYLYRVALTVYTV